VKHCTNCNKPLDKWGRCLNYPRCSKSEQHAGIPPYGPAQILMMSNNLLEAKRRAQQLRPVISMRTPLMLSPRNLLKKRAATLRVTLDTRKKQEGA